MRLANSFDVVINVKDAIKTLKKNKKRHAKIVKEARRGYIERAEKILNNDNQQLDKDVLLKRTCTALGSLELPQDYTDVYDTTIQMLELHQEETVEMTGEQVRCLMMDNWDWTRHFIATNSKYSVEAINYATEKGIN